MKMVDAGSTYDSPVAYETKEPKKSYPRLCLDLEAFPGLNEVGKEISLIVKGKVVAVRDDQYSGSIDIEVRECGVADSEAKNDADKELEKMAKK